MTEDLGALRAALGFTAGDLQANRQGLLSRAQAARLKRSRLRNTLLATGIFSLLALAATALIYLGQLNRNMILTSAGAGLVLLNAIVIGGAGRAYIGVSQDLRANRAEALTGAVERVLRRGRAGDSYLLRVGGVELNVNRDIFVVFEHKAAYHIYRTSFSRQLLSAEPAV
ncbi:MAG: hypothetical protein OXG85_12280 [Chloroflexi bacterium]|nr:hypothetical protein [Chloroflexota bacterium]